MTDNNYTKYIGKRMSWKTMQETFPNMWVCVSDYKEINTDSLMALLKACAKQFKKRITKQKDYIQKRKKFIGTM